jgi:hypothetical protein
MKLTLHSILLLLITFKLSFSQTPNPKRGVAYGHLSEADLEAISTNLSWWYNWYHKPEDAVASVYETYDMDFVPMAWNDKFDETALRSFLGSHPNVKYLLGFNEPNFLQQANMTPSKAAEVWPKLEAIANDFGLKLVGPAVNWCGSCVSEGGVTYTDPYKYLDDFFAKCPNCKVDYIAIHNYMCYAGALSSYVDGFKKYGKKIWLTEFACWDQATITLAMQKSYIMGALDYLDNDSMVFRYSWFTGDRSGKFPYLDLFKPASGQLTDLGKLYVSYNATHDTNLYAPVPARIEAESYSSMYGVQLEATQDIDGNANVGWIDAKDWLIYNINVPETRNYYIYLRIASNASTSAELLDGTTSIGTVEIPNSGGWQNWKTYQISVTLTQGLHKLKVYAPTGGFNINWLFISDTPLSIERPINNFKIYPNPVQDLLNIENTTTNSGNTVVNIYDQLGKKVMSTQITQSISEIDISRLKKGFYLVRVSDANWQFTKYIIKI